MFWIMNTRGRLKQSEISRGPVDLTEGPSVSTGEGPEPVVRRSTRGKAEVPATRKSRVVVTPVKRRVSVKKRPVVRGPKRKTAHVLDEESESPPDLEDLDLQVEESDEESQLEIERLRKQLTELEDDQRSCNPLKEKRSELGPLRETRQMSSPPDKVCNPAEGRTLGTFNGKTDLDTFLVRFETCSRLFGWSKSERVFYLMNALTDSAEIIVKEVGPFGTLENILGLLQSRFGNKLRLETFHAELRKRRRGPNETLQDLYLDLCRLRALVASDVDAERYPEMYFRKIFVDSLNDRELRRMVLVQNPGTMEEAYQVATRMEAVNAYETPVSEVYRSRPRIQQMDLENETFTKFQTRSGT